MFARILQKLYQEEKGVAVVLFALFLPVCLLMAGLVIDGGVLAYQKLKLNHAVDAASLAAAKSYDKTIWNEENRLVINPEAVYVAADQYLTSNMKEAAVTKAVIEENTGTSIRVAVEGEVSVTLYFSGFFNSESKKVLTARTVSSINAPEESLPSEGETNAPPIEEHSQS